MTSLRQALSALTPSLQILEPVQFSSDQWSVLERLHGAFNDRQSHTRLPMPIARFRSAAAKAIHEHARRFDEVRTVYVDEGWDVESVADAMPDAMASHARLYNADVDQLISVLVPSARYRKGHYAYGRFTVPQPHGLHTDHSAEDLAAEGEPICIARIRTLGTHYVSGDYEVQGPETRSMLNALRYWTVVREVEPEDVFDELLRRGVLKTMPVDHVMLMVAGNGSRNSQVTQHMAARPPDGGLHSAFFQRQYRLASGRNG